MFEPLSIPDIRTIASIGTQKGFHFHLLRTLLPLASGMYQFADRNDRVLSVSV